MVLLVAMALAASSGGQGVGVTARARALQPGEVVLLTITTTSAVETVEARVFDREVLPWRIDDTTWQALVGIDLDTAPGSYTVTVDAGAAGGRARYDLDVVGKEFRTRRLTVAPSFVDPPPEVQDRIVRDATRLNAIYRNAAPRPEWTGGFVRPVPHEANSAFGSRSIFNGQPRSPHSGADFLSPAGTPIGAPNAGRVVLADDLYYTGGTVVIDHGLGVISVLAHLSAIDVSEGTRVDPGDVVGKVGATGRVTGAHLHWTLRVGGIRVDPLSMLDLLGASGS
jgi:murein DD-endopeptidase MepM/ murein hydrolase activator NlpD